MNKRLQAFSSWLQQHSSFAFVTSSANVFYLSGFRCDPHERLLALLVFPDSEPALVCPQMEVPRARRSGFGHTVIGYDDSADPWEEIERHLKARGVKAVSIAVEKTICRSPVSSGSRRCFRTPNGSMPKKSCASFA